MILIFNLDMEDISLLSLSFHNLFAHHLLPLIFSDKGLIHFLSPNLAMIPFRLIYFTLLFFSTPPFANILSIISFAHQ